MPRAQDGNLSGHQRRRIQTGLGVHAARHLALGTAADETRAYNISKNALGEIILDPVRRLTASEIWLDENPRILAGVRQGLKEVAE